MKKLSREKHIETICEKASAGIGTIRRVNPYVPVDILQTIYKVLVPHYFDYCSPLCDNCKLLQDKLQKFQSRVARVITGPGYDIRSIDVLDNLSWETLDVKRPCTKSISIYKILNHTAPNLKESFRRRNVCQNTYNLRNNETYVAFPKRKTEFLKQYLKADSED